MIRQPVEDAFDSFVAAQGDAWRMAPPHIQDLIRSSWLAGAFGLLSAIACTVEADLVAAVRREIEDCCASHPARTLQ